MTVMLNPLSTVDAKALLDQGKAVLVDIRERDEFSRRHIAGALSKPLSSWEASWEANWEAGHLAVPADCDVIFTCRSGMRTAGASDRLAARVLGAAHVLNGGVDAWGKAGLPLVIDAKSPIEIMRQVQIAAGSLVLVGVILGFLVAPSWFGLSAFVGAGLTFAGATGFCGMARLLMFAPWNRRAVAG